MPGLVGAVTPSHVASGGITVALPQAATAGNFIGILVAVHSGTASSSSPAITLPTGFTALPTAVNSNATTADKTSVGFYYKTAAGGETSVAFTTTNNGGGSSALAFEWAGVGAFDVSGSNTSSAVAASSRTDTSGAITPTDDSDLIFAWHVKLSTAATGTPTSTWNNGFTALWTDPFTNQLSIALGYQTVTSNSPVTPSLTWSANGSVLGTLTKGFAVQYTVTATATLTLSGSAAAAAAGSGTGTLTLSGTGVASTTGAGALSLSGTATAAAPTSGTASISLTGTGTTRTPVAGMGAVTLTSSAAASATSAGTAVLSLSGTGTAHAVEPTPPERIATIGLEDRTYLPAAESRLTVIPAEPRTVEA